MLIQTIHVDVKVCAEDTRRNLTLYTLTRNQPGKDYTADVKVIEKDKDNDIFEIQGMDKVTPVFLELDIPPFCFDSKDYYESFNNEFLKGLLIGHKHGVGDFTIKVTQTGKNFTLIDFE